MYRVANHVNQPRYILRITQAHRHVEDFFRQFDYAFHFRATTGQHDSGSTYFFKTATPQFGLHQAQQFFVTRLYYFGQGLTREATWLTITPGDWAVRPASSKIGSTSARV